MTILASRTALHGADSSPPSSRALLLIFSFVYNVLHAVPCRAVPCCVQGSTCVYSRKVEHVYQLVLRTIEFLTEQKQGTNGAKQTQNAEEDATQSPTEEVRGAQRSPVLPRIASS